MFFGKNYILLYYKKNNQKTSLQACHEQLNPNSSDSELNPNKNIKRKFQRTFFLTPSKYNGSMCVEASLSFSFFLFFLTNIFSLIFLFRTYTQDMTNLQQQGKQLASIAYVTEGLQGRNDELIRLHKSRKVESMYSLIAVPDARLRASCVVKPWTGYDVVGGKNREEEDILVYMTQYGSVYHKDRGCTHLSLSIQPVDLIGLEYSTNEGGRSYTPCEYCGENGFVTLVYITNYGDRYHTTIKCRGLRRYVRSLPLSQVNGVPACQKCG
ncbi:MAG: hypothetical protein IKW30_04135 [Lachnospiraceae bacterium]|nr:hypothetical protein [Lachnospiraceae bacterium]